MSEVKVNYKDGLLSVDSSDLIREARQKAPKDLLEIAPFIVHMEMNFAGLNINDSLEKKIRDAAGAKAKAIQKELVTELKKLIDDLTVLRKQDQQGSDKAGDSAEKRVKTVADHVETTLYDFGYDVRKSFSKLVKIPTTVKSVSSGQFRGIKLVYAFKGGAKAAYAEAYEETAKEFDKLGDEALSGARDEESQRESVLRSLEDALKSVHEQTAEQDKEKQQLELKLAKAERKLKDAKDGSEKKYAMAEVEEIREELKALPGKQVTAWGKWVIQEARSMQSQMQGWGGQLEQFKKLLEAADKDALKALGKLKKDAEDKEKKAIQKVIEELHKLTRGVTSRQATVSFMTGEYKKWGATAAKRDEWLKRLERDVPTVKTMKDFNAQDLNKAAREMVQIAGKMG